MTNLAEPRGNPAGTSRPQGSNYLAGAYSPKEYAPRGSIRLPQRSLTSRDETVALAMLLRSARTATGPAPSIPRDSEPERWHTVTPSPPGK
jgi:hypothetical protein